MELGDATEHIAATWVGAVAFSNLSLPGKALRGKDEKVHLKRTTKLVTDLFEVTQQE